MTQLDAKLKRSDFVGIIIDVTENFTVDKMIMFAKLLMKGRAETCFLGKYTLQCGTTQCLFDTVVDVLRNRGVPLSKVIGLGSDGASVMTGKSAGVGALLK